MTHAAISRFIRTYIEGQMYLTPAVGDLKLDLAFHHHITQSMNPDMAWKAASRYATIDAIEYAAAQDKLACMGRKS